MPLKKKPKPKPKKAEDLPATVGGDRSEIVLSLALICVACSDWNIVQITNILLIRNQR